MVTMIDFFILLKYIIMLFEKAAYSEDYPKFVLIDVVLKMMLQFMLFLAEWILVMKYKKFEFCKLTYGIKFILIIGVLFTSFCF